VNELANGVHTLFAPEEQIDAAVAHRLYEIVDALALEFIQCLLPIAFGKGVEHHFAHSFLVLVNLFGEHAYNLNISATKSMTGHLLGATGAVEAIISVLAVKNDIIPPTINHSDDDIDEEIDYRLNLTFNKAQKRTVRAALSNTFGFGGHNGCVIVKRYE